MVKARTAMIGRKEARGGDRREGGGKESVVEAVEGKETNAEGKEGRKERSESRNDKLMEEK